MSCVSYAARLGVLAACLPYCTAHDDDDDDDDDDV